jgi:hypothetical protein
MPIPIVPTIQENQAEYEKSVCIPGLKIYGHLTEDKVLYLLKSAFYAGSISMFRTMEMIGDIPDDISMKAAVQVAKEVNDYLNNLQELLRRHDQRN